MKTDRSIFRLGALAALSALLLCGCGKDTPPVTENTGGEAIAFGERIELFVDEYLIESMDNVSFRLLSGKKCTDLCGRISGREAFLRLGERLDHVQFAGEADLGACIRSDLNPGADDGVTYIISDLLTDSDWRGAVDLLLSRRREVALIQVLSPEELEPELSGRYTFCDAEETGAKARMTMDVDRDALKAYRETVNHFLAEIRRFCASRDVPYLLMKSSERAEDVLRTRGCMEELIR